MGITCPKSLSSFHLAIIKSTVKCQKRKVFQFLKHKRNHCWQSTMPKYLLNQRRISAGNVAQRKESDSTCQTIARRKQLASKYNTVCIYTNSQLCHALRTVQKAMLSKETARKEPGCMPFISFPVHKYLHLFQETGTGWQHSGCFSLISPQQLLGFHWQPLEAARKKCTCNSVIDDDFKYENEHIQTFLLTRKE